MSKIQLEHWVSAVFVVLLAAIPPLSDQYPNLVPSLLALFPKHGQQWIPIVGVLLTVAASVARNVGLIDRVRTIFAEKGDGTQ